MAGASGGALLVLSVVFGWYVAPFAPDPFPVYATQVSLLQVLFRGQAFIDVLVPTVAQLFAGLGLGAGALSLMGRGWPDIVRRIIGGVALLVVGMVAWRLSVAFDTEHLPPDVSSFPGILRVGFYLATLAAIILIAAPGSRARA